jgi:hypothetical protein
MRGELTGEYDETGEETRILNKITEQIAKDAKSSFLLLQSLH